MGTAVGHCHPYTGVAKILCIKTAVGGQVTYERGRAPLCGRRTWENPLAAVNITLADSEFINGVVVKAGVYLDSLTFISNLKTYGPYGGDGGNVFKFNGRVFGIVGAVQTFGGYALQAIGFLY